MRMVVKRKLGRFKLKLKSSDVGTLVGQVRKARGTLRGVERVGWTLVSCCCNVGRMGQLSFSLTLEAGSMSQQ